MAITFVDGPGTVQLIASTITLSPSPWQIVAALGTCAGVLLALTLAVASEVHRRRDRGREEQERLDQYSMGVITEMVAILSGRLKVSGPGIPPENPAPHDRDELRLPALVAVLPPDWTGLLRWADGYPGLSGATHARYVSPWRKHPLWGDTPGSIPSLHVLIADLTFTLDCLARRQPRVWGERATPLPENIGKTIP